jgi:hypothetical protein
VPTTTATGPVARARTSCIRGLKTRPRSHKSWTRCRGLVKEIFYRQGQIRANLDFFLYTQTITSAWVNYTPMLYYAPTEYWN